MKSQLLYLFLCGLLYSNLSAQNPRADSIRIVLNSVQDDTSRIKSLHQMTGALMNNTQDSALYYAHKAYDLSQEQEDPYFLGQSTMNITHAYFVNGHVDSAKISLLNAIPFFKKHDKHFWLSASYRNLAVIGEAEEEPDTSLYYLDKCIEVLEVHPDSIVLGDVYLSKGFAYRTKGFYELSIEALLNSMRIFEVIGNTNRKGYVAQNLGLTLYQSGRLQEGLDRNEESIEYFLEAENIRAAAQSLNNVGVYHYKLKEYKNSKSAHLKSLDFAKQTEQNDVMLDIYLNLSNVYFEEENLDSAQYWAQLADELSMEMDYQPGKCTVAISKSWIALEQERNALALSQALEAEKYIDSYVDPQSEQEICEDLSEIFEELNRPSKSLMYWKRSKSIQDSLFTLKQDQQVEELNLIYQTEKKDAAIELLNKNAELDALKRKGLWGGMGLIILAGLTFLYGLVQRNKKKQAVLEQEKVIEAEKRLHAEEQLEFKKKELMAKVLQLASKNEFLQKLEEEVLELKSSVDTTVTKTSQRISRMIHQDSLDADEWNQFSKEFSSVHENFIETVIAKYGNLTQSEMRLITLLKMNLASKEIANILRVSSGGIKKARYRLRKKLGLEAGEDLQAIILAM